MKSADVDVDMGLLPGMRGARTSEQQIITNILSSITVMITLTARAVLYSINKLQAAVLAIASYS